MNNLEETYQHPGITCKHELNISDFETFANELSQKLNLSRVKFMVLSGKMGLVKQHFLKH